MLNGPIGGDAFGQLCEPMQAGLDAKFRRLSQILRPADLSQERGRSFDPGQEMVNVVPFLRRFLLPSHVVEMEAAVRDLKG